MHVGNLHVSVAVATTTVDMYTVIMFMLLHTVDMYTVIMFMLLYAVDMYTVMKEQRYVTQGKQGEVETFVVTLSGFTYIILQFFCIVM